MNSEAKEQQMQSLIHRTFSRPVAGGIVVLVLLSLCGSVYTWAHDDAEEWQRRRELVQELLDLDEYRDAVFAFSEGITKVRRNFKYGFVDQYGNIVAEPVFEKAVAFNEGLAAFKQDDKWGYLNRLGQTVIEPQFAYTWAFREGLAGFSPDGEKWGYINHLGRVVIEPRYEDNSGFSEGLAAVQLDGDWGYIDPRGELVIEPQFEEVEGFSEGLAPVKLHGKWGYIDRSGELIIEPQYDEANRFSEGLAAVRQGEKTFFIDKFNQTRIELPKPLDPDLISFRDGEADSLHAITDEALYSIHIDYRGNVLNEREISLADAEILEVVPDEGGFLGIHMQDLTPETAQELGYDGEGVLITDVIENSAAEKAGLKEKDIIVEIDGVSIKDSNELRTQITQTLPGAKVKLSVFRDGWMIEIPVKLGDRADYEQQSENHAEADDDTDDE